MKMTIYHAIIIGGIFSSIIFFPRIYNDTFQNNNVIQQPYNFSDFCMLTIYGKNDSVGWRVKVYNLTQFKDEPDCSNLKESCLDRQESSRYANYTSLRCRWYIADTKSPANCECEY